MARPSWFDESPAVTDEALDVLRMETVANVGALSLSGCCRRCGA